MTINFNKRRLADVCNSKQKAWRSFGKQNGNKVLQRLSEIRASDNLAVLSELKHIGFHSLKGTRMGQFAVNVKHPYRVVFVPDHDPIPKKEDGSVDLEKITKVLILEVLDYHG